MDKDTIDLDRVVHDPEYRRLVIERLKAQTAAEAAAPVKTLAASDRAGRGPQAESSAGREAEFGTRASDARDYRLRRRRAASPSSDAS